jgi:Ca2+-binding EF-hand superfamily protein
MNPRTLGVLAVLAAALLLTVGSAPAADRPKSDVKPPAADDVQDFIFLGETRPVLVRIHVRIDGKSVQAAWDDFIKYLFTYLDVNGDGVLSKEEAARAPSVTQIVGGAGAGFGGRGGGGTPGPTMEALDADKDGKVTLAEFAAYYRKNGLAPVQIQTSATGPSAFGGAAAFLGGRQTAPAGDAVGEAVFRLLDTNKDGKLTRAQLAQAPALLLQVDTDDDEIVTPEKLVPSAGRAPRRATPQMRAPGGPAPSAENSNVVLVGPGADAAALVRRLQERYGPKADRPQDKTLSRQDLGLDQATFDRLDTDHNGRLDRQELAAFTQRPPDLELILRLGTKGLREARLEVVKSDGQSPALAGKVKSQGNGVVSVDLGLTQIELRGGGEREAPDLVSGFARQFYQGQFKQADTGNKGYLDAKDAQGNRLFRTLFKAMDRDGDGKLYEKEMLAYLDQYREIQARGTASCVTLVLGDEGRGLFDLLDTNHDGRLSVREMRQAPQLLARLDRDGKGYLTRADLPRNHRLVLRRGPANVAHVGREAFSFLYGSGATRAEPAPTRGPLWFRKMDRNRDGDVSRKEFLGTDEEFRAIDTDGDGLISVEEAERYDARLRKSK